MKTQTAAAVCAGMALWLSLGLLTVTDAETAHRIGLLPALWLLPVCIAVAAAIVFGLLRRRVTCLPLFLSFGIVLPWLPLPVPAAVLAITGPAVLFVWSAIAGALAVAAGRSATPSWRLRLQSPQVAQYAAGVFAFAVFLVVWAGQRLPPTGDEPHYLLTAQSLLLDGDVKVANNYERRDYLPYYGGFLTPHYSPPGVDGALYPGHGVGLSTLIAPLFALGGYRAVAIFIAALVALGTALVWKAAFVLTRDAASAWFGWAVVTVTVPVAVYASLIYPDSLAGVVFAACALAVVLAQARGDARAAWPLAGSIALGISIGLLAWLHIRLALPASIFAVVLLARALAFRERRWIHATAIAAPFGLCIAGFMAFSWLTYGTVNPAASVGDRSSLVVQRIPIGLLSLLTDQEFGLLPSAPIHVLSFAAIGWVFTRSRRLGVDLFLIVVPYTLTLSAWSIWWAGACPPARFLVPMIFPLGVAAADVWARQSNRAHALTLTILGASITIAAAFAWGGDGALGYNDATGRARWLEWASPLVDLTRAAPSFFRAGSLTPTAQTIADLVWPATIWTGAAIAAWLVFVGIDRGQSAAAPARALTAGVACGTAALLAISASWRVVGGPHVTPARTQLDAINRGRGRLPIAVQFSPWSVGRSRDLLARLAITTPPRDTVPRNTLLRLTDVPAGNYRLQVVHSPPAAGELHLAIGSGMPPVERWTVSDDENPYAFHLGTFAATIAVIGDEAALRSVKQVALMPDGGDSLILSHRARSAARYGAFVVYALDDRVSLEDNGFWVLGERRPDVVVSAARPITSLDITVHNRPIANTIRVRSGRWYVDRAMQPDEAWHVRVPLPDAARDIVLGFDVEHGVRPSDLEPGSRDRRLLGCWIEMR